MIFQNVRLALLILTSSAWISQGFSPTHLSTRSTGFTFVSKPVGYHKKQNPLAADIALSPSTNAFDAQSSAEVSNTIDVTGTDPKVGILLLNLGGPEKSEDVEGGYNYDEVNAFTNYFHDAHKVIFRC